MLTEREKEVNVPEQMDSIGDDSKIDTVITKIGSFESVMAMGKLREKHKIQGAEILLDLILQAEAVAVSEESKLLYINPEPTSVLFLQQVTNFCMSYSSLLRKLMSQKPPKF